MFPVLKKDAPTRYASKSAPKVAASSENRRDAAPSDAEFFPHRRKGCETSKRLSYDNRAQKRRLPAVPGVPTLSIERNSDEIEEICSGPGGIIRDGVRCFGRHGGIEKWRSSDRYGRNLGRQEHHPQNRLCRRNPDSMGVHFGNQN